MSPIRVTFCRTIGMARNLYSTPLAIGGFLAAAAALLAFNLAKADGGTLSLPAVWAVSVSPLLPILAAFLAMDVWSDERQTGRIDLLLTVAVRERDYVIGKFLGVWTMMMATVLLFLLSSLVFLWTFAPSALSGLRLVGFVPALMALGVQGMLWCAASVALSALFCHAAAALCSALVLLVAVPRGIWAALMEFFARERPAFGDMPVDVHAMDCASGLVSLGAVAVYLVLAALMLFVAVRFVVALRFVGRGAGGLRASTVVAIILSFMAAALAIVLALRLDVAIDLPIVTPSAEFSSRTRNILAETDGDVTVTCFLPRRDPRFREVGHFLRRLKREAAAAGGARFTIRFVDPNWDLGEAARLVRRGVSEGSVVFERGRRLSILSLNEGWGERLCASVISRLTTNPRRRSVYWTVGHGENAFAAYDTFGMSDIARDLSREGYRNLEIDLAANAPVPGDCALIVMAGVRTDLSRTELGRLDAYLREGGRVLALLGSTRAEGLVSLLTSWGLRPTEQTFADVKTLSGTDVVVSEFSNHEIVMPLRGSRIVLERPISFAPSATAAAGAGVDRVEFASIAAVDGRSVAAIVERGVGVGADLAIRPTRIVAIGDVGFAMNGELARRAGANRDFFLNCIAYLSGTDAVGASGSESNVMVLGMDRALRVRHLAASVAAFPLAVFLLMLGLTLRRRRR